MSTKAVIPEIPGKRRIPREVRFGNYVLGSTLGEGEFGKVKLGWRKDGKLPSQAAIKLIKRDSIPTGSEKEGKIYREITALKKLRHPNIVRLVEVLQNDKYIGIVLEYASGGELFDYILEHRYLKDSFACRLFAQLVSGVNYMHSKGIVHRDLKLENLLLDKHKNIIITDFGFVNSFTNKPNDLMKTSCGSPCYAAPELVVSNEPYEGKKVDVWSCGIILYAMLAGYLPFDDDPENPDGTNISRLYHYITHTPLTFPEFIQPTPRDLLRKILVSNPNKRISLNNVIAHRWLAPHAPFLSVSPIEWDKNYRSSRILTQQDKVNRRMSLMENPTSASLILNKQSVRSYSTQNVNASLYSNPAAPQTSIATAIPSAETSPVSSPMRLNNNSNSTIPTAIHTMKIEANNDSNNEIVTRHSRSGSTASLVLQAVVDADYEIKRRYSNSSNELLATPIKAKSTQRPISFIPLLTSDKNKNFETIKESPEHPKPHVLAPLAPPNFSNSSSPKEVSTTKLPSSRTNKPRPTSYHPSYTPNSLNSPVFGSSFTPADLSFLAKSNYSENSLKNIPKFSSNYSSTSESLISSIKENKAGDVISNSLESLSIMSSSSPITTSNLKEEIINEDVDVTLGNDVSTDHEDNDNNETVNHINKSNDAINETLNIREHPIGNKTKDETIKLPTQSYSTAATSVDPKYKRFSLLTFYQNIPGPTSSTSNYKPTIHEDERPIVVNETSHDRQRKVTPPTIVKPKSSRRNNLQPLEPSNKNERKVSGVNIQDKERETTSTARKVMDFFKRRSMRI